jgi:tetratricopeptide (TPR) repeat protein
VWDGTVFVGSWDNNLYAVDAGVEGSSEGSRALLGTQGHHEDWQYANQSITIPAYALYMSRIRNNSVVLTGGIGSVVVGGYLFRRRNQSSDHSQEETPEQASDDTVSEGSETNTESAAPADETTTDSRSVVEARRTAAETAIETAETARSNDNFTTAADAYSEALTAYQGALSALQAGATEQRSEIQDAIESTRTDLETVTTRRDQRNDVTDALQPAERSIQEAIVAFVNGDQTIARIRFRQARDAFDEAMEILDNSDVDVLSQPIEVDVEPDRALSSSTLRELPAISESAASTLAKAGIATVDELDNSEESPWIPPDVAELAESEALSEDMVTVLTLLSWWGDDETYTFETAEAVSRRQQQADYGFNQTA